MIKITKRVKKLNGNVLRSGIDSASFIGPMSVKGVFQLVDHVQIPYMGTLEAYELDIRIV